MQQAKVKIIYILVLINICVCYGYLQHTKRQGNPLLVQTSKGNLIGKNDQTATGTAYLAFQGVPYAKPPLNELRFEPPKSFSWTDTWNATYEREECTQAFPGFLIPIRGREDCLYLNIYTTSVSKPLKPVMVWIYGGSYVFGSGNKDIYSPEYFLERNVVVVTFNYRLGVFGFLSTGDEVVKGNAGLKDQVFALKWIKENIEFFGGDPSKVTIMGESSGAGSVGYLIQSKAARGLFQGGILQSWTPINGLIKPEKRDKGFKRLAEAFGVANKTNREIVDKLKTVDFSSLLLYQVVLTEKLREGLFDETLFDAVLEKETKSGVITKPLYEQLERCDFDSVPIIIGFNSEESVTYESIFNDLRHTYIVFDVNPENLLTKDINVYNKCNPKETGQKIKDHYAGRNGSFVFQNNVILRYASDILFMRTAVEYAKRYSKCNKHVYLYEFSYVRNKTALGAGHTDELRYLFPTFPVVTQREPLNEEEQKVSDDIVNLWSNFMRTGNPTPNQNEFKVKWGKSTEKSQFEYLDINVELTTHKLNQAPFKKDYDLWEGLYKTCGRIKGV